MTANARPVRPGCHLGIGCKRARLGLAPWRVYAVVDEALSPDFPLGDAVETFIRLEDAERFIEEVRGDDPEVAAKLRIEERELAAGGQN
jgi:hypothetical protein